MNRNVALYLRGLEDKPYTISEIDAAFKKRAKVFHPDGGGNAQLFIDLQRAHKTMKESSLVIITL